jgi:DNA-binding response OmpR family regulator
MSRRRVLVVDDDPDVLETIAWAVDRGGYDVVSIDRFDRAKQFVRATPPDALVTDVRLGAFNGLQLAVLLRSLNASAPVVVISAFDDAVIRQETERIGGVFLTKPVSEKTLNATLRTLFGDP